MDSTHSHLKDWRQGSIAPFHQLKNHVKSKLSSLEGFDEHSCVVVSQSCDIVLPADTDVEVIPLIEILSPEAVNGNFRDLRNPRKLHFAHGVSDQLRFYELNMSDRFWVSKTALDSLPPVSYFNRNATKLIAAWMGRRYTRIALPDTFDSRLKKGKKWDKLKKHVTELDEIIRHIYIRLENDEEITEITEVYSIQFILAAKEEYINELGSDMDIVAKMDDIKVSFKEKWEGIGGISVTDVRPMSEKFLTLDDVQQYDIWDFWDYLSSDD